MGAGLKRRQCAAFECLEFKKSNILSFGGESFDA
jgi:hypothetical protein